MKNFSIYILTNKRNGTLYVGVTSDLPKRIQQHKTDLINGFSKQHQTHQLVYFENIEDATAAITREKQLKAWKRSWKIRLIEEHNPQWMDLSETI